MSKVSHYGIGFKKPAYKLGIDPVPIARWSKIRHGCKTVAQVQSLFRGSHAESLAVDRVLELLHVPIICLYGFPHHDFDTPPHCAHIIPPHDTLQEIDPHSWAKGQDNLNSVFFFKGHEFGMVK